MYIQAPKVLLSLHLELSISRRQLGLLHGLCHTLGGILRSRCLDHGRKPFTFTTIEASLIKLSTAAAGAGQVGPASLTAFGQSADWTVRTGTVYYVSFRSVTQRYTRWVGK